MLISEKELRAHVRELVATRAAQNGSRMFEELQVEHGAARVDIALVGSELHAFELKSDFDDFSRMHNQIHAYNRVFDRITIVTGQLHGQAAMKIVPSWWGVMCVSRGPDEALRTETLRDAATHDMQQPLSLAMLLWREEALLALQSQLSQKTRKRATRSQLQSQLAEVLGLGALRTTVTSFLLNRNSQFKEPTRSVRRDDLLHRDASCLDSHFLL